MEPYMTHHLTFWNKTFSTDIQLDIIGEVPLAIHIQGRPYSVVMRTPGLEHSHAAGLCFAEGIIDTPDDIVSIEFENMPKGRPVRVTIAENCTSRLTEHQNRRGYVNLTGHGLSAGKLVENLIKETPPIQNNIRINIRQAFELTQQLSVLQELRNTTKASHAAALYDSDLSLLTIAEDVGRHNAIDKAIGTLFLKRQLEQAKVLVLSSRISYELVQKASRARIPIILAMSRPTSLAIETAIGLNMTLAGNAKGRGLFLFCGQQRIFD